MVRGAWIKLLVVLALVFCSACSSRQWYDAVQGSQRHACHQEMTQDAYQECVSGYQQSYQDYERERQQAQ